MYRKIREVLQRGPQESKNSRGVAFILQAVKPNQTERVGSEPYPILRGMEASNLRDTTRT